MLYYDWKGSRFIQSYSYDVWWYLCFCLFSSCLNNIFGIAVDCVDCVRTAFIVVHVVSCRKPIKYDRRISVKSSWFIGLIESQLVLRSPLPADGNINYRNITVKWILLNGEMAIEILNLIINVMGYSEIPNAKIMIWCRWRSLSDLDSEMWSKLCFKRNSIALLNTSHFITQRDESAVFLCFMEKSYVKIQIIPVLNILHHDQYKLQPNRKRESNQNRMNKRILIRIIFNVKFDYKFCVVFNVT